jgi:hypothetical protein
MTAMNRVYPTDLPQFLRRFRATGGTVRGVRVRHRAEKDAAVEFRLTVREPVTKLGETPKKVRLTLRLDGVEEFRFQMRPGQHKSRVADARIGYLNGLFYVSLDALGLEPNEAAQVFDFRASEVYAAGRELSWSEGERPV